jgi:hypothetical protein
MSKVIDRLENVFWMDEMAIYLNGDRLVMRFEIEASANQMGHIGQFRDVRNYVFEDKADVFDDDQNTYYDDSQPLVRIPKRSLILANLILGEYV